MKTLFMLPNIAINENIDVEIRTKARKTKIRNDH